MNNKRSKLIMSIVTLVLCLGVMCFGVYSATNVTYTIGGNITYELNDVFVDVDTELYASTQDYHNTKGDMATALYTLYQYYNVNNQSGTIDPIITKVDSYQDSGSSTNTGDITPGTETFQSPDLPINYGAYQNDGDTFKSFAYFVVVTITNHANEAVNATLDINIDEAQANTLMFYQENMQEVEPATDEATTKSFLIGFLLDDISQSVNTALSDQDMTLTINRGRFPATEGLVYEDLGDGRMTITDYTGESEKVVIPGQHNGKIVSIGTNAFQDSNMTSIYISPVDNHYTAYYVPEGAFANSNLQHITLTKNLSTGVLDNAFSNCALRCFYQTYYSTMPSYGSMAFYNCRNLISFYIRTSSIGGYAFSYCASLEKITLRGLVVFGTGIYTTGSFMGTTCPIVLEKDFDTPDFLLAFISYYGKEIVVDEENSSFSDIDGVLYNKDQTKLMYIPFGYDKPELYIPSTVTSCDSNFETFCNGYGKFTSDLIIDSTYIAQNQLDTLANHFNTIYIKDGIEITSSSVTEPTFTITSGVELEGKGTYTMYVKN